MRLVIIAVLALDGLLAQTGARPAILAANKTLSQAVAKGSVEMILGVYAAKPEMVPPEGPPIAGREAVAKMWKGFIDQGTNVLELETTDVDTHTDTADEQGRYTVKKTDGSIDKGQYHSVWVRERGAWKLQRISWK
jgi:ketosteroid isomerase-like protein